jgi:hypothetical protein
MGDVKLALVIGLLLGWFGLNAWLIGLLAAFVVGGLVALVALLLRRVTLRGSIPFGPSMLAGALVALLVVGAPETEGTDLRSPRPLLGYTRRTPRPGDRHQVNRRYLPGLSHSPRVLQKRSHTPKRGAWLPSLHTHRLPSISRWCPPAGKNSSPRTRRILAICSRHTRRLSGAHQLPSNSDDEGATATEWSALSVTRPCRDSRSSLPPFPRSPRFLDTFVAK